MRELIIAESPASYATRPPLVIDASVIASAIFAESRQEDAWAVMRGHSLRAPQVVDFEMANTAVNKFRRGALGLDAAVGALCDFAALDLERHRVPPEEAFELAIECNLTAYDAAYLWLAIASNAALATFDARLGEAARQRLAKPGGTR